MFFGLNFEKDNIEEKGRIRIRTKRMKIFIVDYAVPVPTGSVADPYHFDTDRDPGCEKFVMDPDPGRILIQIWIQAKTIRIRIQHTRIKYQENI